MTQQVYMTRDLKSSLTIRGTLYQRLAGTAFRAIRTHGKRITFSVVVDGYVVATVEVPRTRTRALAAAWFAKNCTENANLMDASA